MSDQRRIIIIRETTAQSIVKDIGSFVMFAGLLYFNHKVLAGSTLIDVIFIIMVLLVLASINSGHVYRGNTDGAIKFLQELKDETITPKFNPTTKPSDRGIVIENCSAILVTAEEVEKDNE